MGNLYIPDAPMAIMCENIQTYVSKIPIRQTKQYNERGERNYTKPQFYQAIYFVTKYTVWLKHRIENKPSRPVGYTKSVIVVCCMHGH